MPGGPRVIDTTTSIATIEVTTTGVAILRVGDTQVPRVEHQREQGDVGREDAERRANRVERWGAKGV